MSCFEPLLGFRGDIAGHPRPVVARRDHVHADAVRGQLDGQVFHEHFQPHLGDAIGRLAERREEADGGADDDDVPAAARNQVLRHFAAGEHGRGQVRIDRLAPRLGVQPGDRLMPGPGGVVDVEVEMPQSGDGLGDHPHHVLFPADVGLDPQAIDALPAKLSSTAGSGLRLATRQMNAFAGQHGGDALADAASAARDQGFLSTKPRFHVWMSFGELSDCA